MSTLTEATYHELTSSIKDNPLHSFVWITHAYFFLDGYPILAVADAYKAYLLAQPDFIPEEHDGLRIKKRNLQKSRNAARLILVHALLALDAVADAVYYLREFEGPEYSDVKDELAEEARLRSLEVSKSGRNPSFKRQKFPWMAEKHASRSQESLRETRKQLAHYGLELKQSTVTDDPQVFGLFAKKNVLAKSLVATDLKCQIVKLKGKPGDPEDLTNYIQWMLKDHVRKASESSQTKHLLDDATTSILTAVYHGVDEFSMKHHVVDIFEILKPRFHVYEETFDF
jgi:hypothetical protein